jgi:hypothetical protein
MTDVARKHVLPVVLAAAGWLCNGAIGPGSVARVATAGAWVGHPATPVR